MISATSASATVTNVNDVPLGLPLITGTATQGETLSADTSGISDPDGLGTFSYQWRAGDSDISGATGETFTLTQAQVGAVITVVVSYSDDEGTAESLTSAPTAAVVAAAAVGVNAGVDQRVVEGATVTLRAVSALEGILSHIWGPATSNDPAFEGINLSPANNVVSPTFIAPTGLAEDRVLEFKVTVLTFESFFTDTVTITVEAGQNDAPVANAGVDQGVATGATVMLDGSGSTDPEKGTLTYAWSQTSGATVALSDATAERPTFTVPAELALGAVLEFSLTVTDPDGTGSLADTVTITVSGGPNEAPVANAGVDQRVAEGAPVTLDGSASTDPDGDTPLTYAWSQTGGATVVLSAIDTEESPTFTPPTLLAPEAVLEFSLIVTDARGTPSAADSVTITVFADSLTTTVSTIDDQPLTLAGGAQRLDVSGNFADFDSTSLTYAATSANEDVVTVSIDATSGELTLTPVAAGSALITVTAQDGSNMAATQSFTVTVGDSLTTTVSTIDDQPLTLAGGAQRLDVSGNFADFDSTSLTYAATSANEDVVTVSIDATSGELTLTPVAAGSALITVTAQDGSNMAATQSFTVTVGDSLTTTVSTIDDQPLTLAGGAQRLDVSGNFADFDSTSLTYAATSANEDVVTVSIDATSGELTLTPVAAGSAVITVTAQDGSNMAATQSFTVTVGDSLTTTVSTIDDQPLTLAGGAQRLDVSGNFADFDSTSLTYAAASANEDVVTVSIDAAGVLTLTPVMAGTSEITVTAQDGSNTPATQSFMVTVGDSAATANAGPDQDVDEGELVTLDGRGSSDPDSNMTYRWTQQSGTPVTLSDRNIVNPTFTAPIRQTLVDDDSLVFRLVVNDSIASDTVIITVTSTVSVQKTVETINRFLHTRTNLILANQPRLSRRINRLQRGVGSEQLSFATGEITKLKPFEFNFLSLGSGNYKFATSLDQVTRAADHLQVMQGDVGGLTATHERRRFDVWFEGSLHKFNGSEGTGGDFGIAYLGADYLASPDLLVGALVQYDTLTDSSTSLNYKIEGKGWMAGPYVTARLRENLYLDARLAYGTSDNEISPQGTYTDSFKSTRRLANISLSGEFTQGQWTIRPNASLSYLADKQSTYTNTLGDTIPSQTVSSGQLQFGPNFSTQFLGDNGWLYEPSFTLDAIYSHAKTSGGLGATPSPEDGWRARLEAGLGMTLSESSRLSFTGNYDGIGQSGFEAWGLGLNLDMKF